MADPFRCINALNQAAGKELSPDEALQVFDQLQRAERDIQSGRIKVDGPVSPEQLTQKAAEIAAQRHVEDKIRDLRNIELKVAAMGARQAEVSAMKAGGIGPVGAVRRLLANHSDGRANHYSLEARAHGTSNLLKARIQDTWAAMGNDFLGFLQQKDKIRDLITEMRGQDSGNPAAKQGAQAWLRIADEARQWFNEKGGKIGHLDDWSMPQHHSQERVAKAGAKQWITDVYPMLNREKYRLDEGFGRVMNETELKDFLQQAWRSIATNGASDITPGEYRRSGATANKHAEHRQVHFKDADALIGYWSKYGDKTFPDILLGHVEKMARDIAFIEHFGPNPEAAYRLLRDEAEIAAKEANPTGMAKIDKELASLDTLFDYAAGKTKPVADTRVATFFDTARNLNVAGKLGSAVWASVFGDKVMLEAIGRLNKLPLWQSWWNELRILNPANAAERNLLRRQALMLDYMSGAAYRFGEELGRSAWTGKLANAVIRASGMAAINEWRRGAFGLTMMDTLGHAVSSKSWKQVSEGDMHLLNNFGIGETEWRLWKLAELEDFGNGNRHMLTPEAIARIPDDKLKRAKLIEPDATAFDAADYRRAAVVKYVGALHSESVLAVIEPNWSDRARQVGGLQRGNLRDEITRSFWQFKSFPISQMRRIIEIGMSRPGVGGKVAFIAPVVIMQTLAGGMMLQTQSLLSGQDPRPMDDWKFWLAAFIKGGSLGIYGDFLYSQSATTRYGSGPLEALAGPTIGSVATGVTSLIQAGNALKDGRDTHLGAKLMGIGKGMIPAQNLWYTRAATDHIIFQNAQEMLSPGYLANMRARSVRDYGQDWWWAPGEALPDRAPNLEATIGR